VSYAGNEGSETVHAAAPMAEAEALYLIEVRGARKKYCRDFRRSLYYGLQDVASALLLRDPHPEELRQHEFWAVDGVSFKLRRGESVGLLGHNGAGKSTLLKLITGQRSLTAGQVTTRGRVVALTELGLGFDGALTGRENAYLNAAILGLPRHKLTPIIEDIIDFAGIREFIDSAVQTYSSGMKARLGFSVATHLEPDILIVDEVLAVGDLAFRRKCIQHVMGYLRRGGSLVLVTHDPGLVQAVCSRCVMMDHGRVVFDGDAVEGVQLYLDFGRAIARPANLAADPSRPPPPSAGGQPAPQNTVPTGTHPPARRRGSELSDEKPVIVDAFELIPEAGPSLLTGQAARVRLRCRSKIGGPVGWGAIVRTRDLRTNIFAFGLGFDGESIDLHAGENVLECRIPHLPLQPGNYAICGGVSDLETIQAIAALGFEDAPDFFSVETGEASRNTNWQDVMQTLVQVPVEWIHSTDAGSHET